MPDILIRGMEMPRTCNDCLICCEHSMLYKAITDRRSPNCPLVELPEHGDLKDADYIRNKLCEMYKSDTLENDHFYGNAALDNVLYTMNNAPVIVPASEEVEA
jgi:hypothetical protein